MNNLNISDFDLSRLFELLQDKHVSDCFKYQGGEIKREVERSLNHIDVIEIKWHKDDVIDRARERGIEVDDDKAREILQIMQKNHDCNHGISWETIDVHLDDLEDERH